MLKAKQAYFQTQVTTTTQGELVVLLYDGAIKYLRLAKEKMEIKDFAEKGILISKAMDIIQELDSSLNMEQGGEISVNLHSLYIFAQRQLLQANLKMDQKLIDEVITMLSSLRDAFAAIINTPEAIQAQKLAPEQAPVNVNQFRDSGPFGINEVRVENITPAPIASMSTRARAYRQQAAGFDLVMSPSLPDETLKATSSASEQRNSESAQPEPHRITPQPVRHEQAASLSSADPTNEISKQTPSAKPQTLQAQPSPNQTPSQALTGFARQMINNSLYKKMALNNSSRAAEK